MLFNVGALITRIGFRAPYTIFILTKSPHKSISKYLGTYITRHPGLQPSKQLLSGCNTAGDATTRDQKSAPLAGIIKRNASCFQVGHCVARGRSFRQRLPMSNGEEKRSKVREVCYADFMQSQVLFASCLALKARVKGSTALVLD